VHLCDSHDAVGDVNAASASWRQALAILEELQFPGIGALRAKLAAAGQRCLRPHDACSS
jgi:hypothetical protein